MINQQISSQSRRSTAHNLRLVLIVLSATTAVVTIWLLVAYQFERSRLTAMAYANAWQQAQDVATTLGQSFGSTMAIATTLADDLTSGLQPYPTIEKRLQAEVTRRPDIDGLAITFEPYVYADDLRLYQMYIYKKNDTFEILDGATYDYTIPPGDDPDAPQTQWYHTPLKNGPVWNEPFLATGAGKILIEYGVPFFRTDPASGQQVAAGVVSVDYSLQDMRTLIGSMELGRTGYAFVFSAAGALLSNPVSERVTQQTIFETPDFQNNADLRAAAQKALSGIAEAVETSDPVTGETLWVFFMPIETTGWVIGIVLKQAEFLPNARTNLYDQVAILLSLAAFLIFGSAVVLRVERGSSRRFWAVVIAAGVIMTSVMGLTAVLGRQVINDTGNDTGVQITNQATLHSYLADYANTLKRTTVTAPVYIRTGVLIQSMRFADPTALVINGYVWQRIPRNTDQEITPGFIFPQLIDEPMQIEEVLRQEHQDSDVIVWSVVATLRQVLDPVRFPLDMHDLQIRLMPADLTTNVVLIPDLESYGPPVPGVMTGLEQNIWINDWVVNGSWYSFQLQNYNTNFGLTNRLMNDIPELSLTIRASRRFLGPFIAYLLPGLVAALMIFAFLLNDQKPDEPQEIVTALNYTAALFFVIVLMHATLRDRVAAISLTYLEYLYLLLYVAIVAVGINTFFVVRYPQFPLVRFRNNLVVKLLYWPAILLVLLAVTLWLFVYR